MRVRNPKDLKKSVRDGIVEIARETITLRDGLSLEIIQNDPWETKVVVFGIPTFLSTISEFKDLSLILEEMNIKFIATNLRGYGWKGDSETLSLGTIVSDILEEVRKVQKTYPGIKVYLLGQGFGANLARYVSRNLDSIGGLVSANALDGTKGINFWDFSPATFFNKAVAIKTSPCYINLRESIPKIKRMTNNSIYTKEMAELWERKYHLGFPVKFIAEAQTIVNTKVKYSKQNLLEIFSCYDQFSKETGNQKNGKDIVEGNHLVFTDYLNEDAIEIVGKWLLSK